MGKEVQLFEGYEGKVPAHLQGEVSDTTKALMGGGGNTKRVSIRGGVWRMMVGSEEVTKNEDRSMNFIVVGSAPAFARTYYAGQYKEGDNKPPTCWSDDGKEPSHLVENKQSDTCATCPQNVKGSGENESRACRYSARVAVLLDGDVEGDVYGMSIPATSLFGDVKSERYKSLQKYAQELATHGFDIRHVVTEMRFDSDSDVPKIMFRAIRPLTEDEWEIVKDLEGTEELEEHVGPRVFSPAEQEEHSEATSALKGKRNPADDDDDEDEEEADEADEKPKSRRSSSKSSAGTTSKKRKVDDDDSDDESGEDSKKSKATKASKSKVSKSDEVDEDEDEEETEPVKRKSKRDEVEDEEDEDLQAIIGEWGDDDDDDDDD